MTSNENGNAGWYSTGYDDMGKEEARLASLYQIPRLWMPKGESKQIVFLDDSPFTIHEHNPNMNGNWRNWITCGKGYNDEPACCEILGIKSRYWVGYYTCVDCSSWTDDNGNTYQYEVVLFPARMGLLKKFKRKQESMASFTGAMFTAARDGERAAGVGDSFDYVRQAKLDKLFEIAQFRGKKLKDFYAKARSDEKVMEELKAKFAVTFDENGELEDRLVPFNYHDALKPKSAQEQREILAGYVRSSGGGGGGGKSSKPKDMDDVPF